MNDRNPVNPDATSDAESHVACITCGYNLRAQSIEDKCPECGTPVERSIRGDLLQYANRDWMRSVTRGAALVKWGVWCVTAYIPLMVVVAILFGIVLAGRVSVVYENVAMYVLTGALVIGLMFGGVGIFIATGAEPRSAIEESPWSARRLARYTVVAVVIASSVQIAMLSIPAFAAVPLLRRSGWACVGVLLTVACIAMFRWFDALARRLPSPELEKRFRRHIRYVAWSIPALAIAHLFTRPGGGAMTSGGAVTIVAGLVYLVAGCAVLLLIIELSRTMSRFSRQLCESAQSHAV